MHRRMTINVNNKLNPIQWSLKDKKLDHGKWMKDSPPKTIPPNQEIVIESEKEAGISYGTTGWIEYEIISNKFAKNVLRIEWNKPYGTDVTTCNAIIVGNDFYAKVIYKDFQHSYAACEVIIIIK